MRRASKIALGAILLAALVAGWIFAQPLAFLPHDRIEIRVPYAESDRPTGIMPMGETIYHPNAERGHPGIDFGWEDNGTHDLVSSSDGVVASVKLGASDPGKWDVVVRTGVYHLVYKEMESTPLAKGDRVAVGDPVGAAGKYCDGDPAAPHCWSNAHWELASVSPIKDRFCPTTYLDAASRASLEAIWASIPITHPVKSQFPELCNGAYEGRVG